MAADFTNYSLKLDGKHIDRNGDKCEDISFKFVGHYLDEFITWNAHTKHVISKLASRNCAIARNKNFLPLKTRITIYNSLFKSHLGFGLLAFGCAKTSNLNKISTLQKNVLETFTMPILNQYLTNSR